MRPGSTDRGNLFIFPRSVLPWFLTFSKTPADSSTLFRLLSKKRENKKSAMPVAGEKIRPLKMKTEKSPCKTVKKIKIIFLKKWKVPKRCTVARNLRNFYFWLFFGMKKTLEKKVWLNSSPLFRVFYIFVSRKPPLFSAVGSNLDEHRLPLRKLDEKRKHFFYKTNGENSHLFRLLLKNRQKGSLFFEKEARLLWLFSVFLKRKPANRDPSLRVFAYFCRVFLTVSCT